MIWSQDEVGREIRFFSFLQAKNLVGENPGVFNFSYEDNRDKDELE